MEPQQVVIRTATPADVGALQELERACFGGEPIAYWVIRQWIDVAGRFFVVADRERVIVGSAHAMVMHDDSVGAWVLSVAVHPSARGLGIADRLLGHLESGLAAAGVSKILATVSPSNAASRRLFARRGYSERGLIEGYFGPGEDRIVLELRPGRDYSRT